jgi:uncharacterized protein
MSTNIERRTATGSVSSTDAKRLTGYAATYGVETVLPDFHEIIAYPAFATAIARGDDTRLLVDHVPSQLLARTAAKNLRLKADSKGLKFDADIPNTTLGRDTAELIRTQTLSGCSFSFQVGEGGDTWTKQKDANGNSYVLRTIRDFEKLYDVSVVCFPQYETGTSVSLRNEIPEAVSARARTFARQTITTGILTQKEIELINLRHRAQGLQILMDSD